MRPSSVAFEQLGDLRACSRSPAARRRPSRGSRTRDSSSRQLADHRLVALLEDVQRHRLARQQHEAEREEREALDGLAHRCPRLAGCRCGERSPGRAVPPAAADARARRAARAGADREARLERGRVRPAAGGGGGVRGRRGRAQPLSGRRRGCALREALAERHGVPPEQVVPGNGADELIRLCGSRRSTRATPPCSRGRRSRATCRPRPCTGPAPCRCRCATAPSTSTPRWPRVAAGAGRREARLSSPTPTTPRARCSTARELRALPRRAARPDVLCVLDEAYAEYADPEPEGPALLREGVRPAVRAAHLLEGLRAGRAAGRLRARLARDRRRARPRAADLQRQPARPGGGARVAARARRGGGARGPRARARASGCTRRSPSAGLEPVRLAGELRLRRRARTATATDWRSGCCARASSSARCGGFGAPGAIRVTCGTDEENAAFAEALARVVPAACAPRRWSTETAGPAHVATVSFLASAGGADRRLLGRAGRRHGARTRGAAPRCARGLRRQRGGDARDGGDHGAGALRRAVHPGA